MSAAVTPDLWIYQTEKCNLVPFVARRANVFPETFLGGLYLKTKEEGLIDTIFAGTNDMNYNHFISYMKNKQLSIYVIKPNTVVGYGWISESEGKDGARKASFGFGFFKEGQGLKETRELIWLQLAWWFEGLDIDILYGATLESNRMAVNFSRHFGFRELCVLPKFFYRQERLDNARLTVLEKSDFMPQYHRWRESLNTTALKQS